jgi:hypothetical protein
MPDTTRNMRLMGDVRKLRGSDPTIRAHARAEVSAGAAADTVYFGTIVSYNGIDADANPRYTVDLYTGWSRTLVARVTGATVGDITADTLTVGASVLVHLPSDDGPPIILPASSGAPASASGDTWHSFGEFGWHSASNF